MKRFFLILSQKKKKYLSHKTIVQQFFLLKNIVSRRYPSGFVVYYTAIFSVVTQRSSPQTLWGGAVRDDTKNACVADYGICLLLGPPSL